MADCEISNIMIAKMLSAHLSTDNYKVPVMVQDNYANANIDILCEVYGGEIRLEMEHDWRKLGDSDMIERLAPNIAAQLHAVWSKNL